ncbi:MULTISPECIES: hypothetical protein [Bradyrhizobium]|uniref:Uncharacterized protein n=1 Tax=Bradyrhizobium elkanii TaxID=29448 RepID=A0A4U6S0F3_BRAEL|nr:MULTISPECIES: hypothetical protein [Bradyrhizobium]MTV16760.1 hypothetical protein [Bradyrhizobium sp. BR2003]TKV80451.1 hypothetical protein FDV58_17005 [Bradyrhizobium elkanii]
MQKLEPIIASLTKRGEQLVAMRAAAQAALDKATKARQAALLSGDLSDQRALQNLQSAVDTAASSVAGLDDALAVLAHDKAEAEVQLTAALESAKRAAAADKLTKQVAAIEAALPRHLEQCRVLADALSEIGHWHFESGQIAGFVQNTMGQTEVAANFALAELTGMPEAIRQGRQAIPGELAPATVATVEPKPETLTVFMMRSAHYLDHDGRKRFAGQWEDAMMPLATAQRALRERVAVPVTDPRRAELRGVRGGDFNPNASDVVDLDAAEPQAGPQIEPDPVLRAAGFTVIDRGDEARSVQIEVPRL